MLERISSINVAAVPSGHKVTTVLGVLVCPIHSINPDAVACIGRTKNWMQEKHFGDSYA